MPKPTLNPKESARQAAIARIRSGEGPVTMHLVAAAFARSYRTIKRWVADEVLKVADIRRGTKFVNRAQVIDLLEACEPERVELDQVDQKRLREGLKPKR